MKGEGCKLVWLSFGFSVADYVEQLGKSPPHHHHTTFPPRPVVYVRGGLSTPRPFAVESSIKAQPYKVQYIGVQREARRNLAAGCGNARCLMEHRPTCHRRFPITTITTAVRHQHPLSTRWPSSLPSLIYYRSLPRCSTPTRCFLSLLRVALVVSTAGRSFHPSLSGTPVVGHAGQSNTSLISRGERRQVDRSQGD